MESLKRPEMIIAIVAATGVLGSSVYFYRKINSQHSELEKLSEHLASTVRQVAEIKAQSQALPDLREAIQKLNVHINQQTKIVTDKIASQHEEFDELQYAIKVITKALKAGGVDINTKMPRRSRRSSRRQSRYDSDSESESDSDDEPPRRRNRSVKKSGGAKKGRSLRRRDHDSDDDDNSDNDSEDDIAAAVAAAKQNRRKRRN